MMTTPLDSVFDRVLSISRAVDGQYATPQRGQNGSSVTYLPALDVHETADAFVLELDLPGVSVEDVELSFEGGVLTIKGQRSRAQQDGDARKWHLAERLNGTFARSITLPERVDGERIEATFTNGVLTISVPKAASALPRRITINAASEGRQING